MTTEEPTPHHADEPVSRLRGASAAVDARKAARVVVGVVLATLAALGILFLVVGINKNNQINELRTQGVPVTYVVSKCLGLLGGSGSNAAGYACQGSYVINHHRYFENLPGTANHAPGTVVAAVSVPSDPTLLSTPGIVASEKASWTVFILPIVLWAAFALLLAVVLIRRRKSAAGADRAG